MDLSPLRDAISRLDDYQWLVFTSQNAVAIFWEQLLGGGRDARSLAGLKVSAVGPATAGALLERGIAVDTIPERFVAEALLEVMTARDDVAGSKVLYVTAEGARDVLPQGLRAIGADVDAVQAYRSITDEAGSARLARAIESGKVHLVTFTSASAVRAFIEAVGAETALRVAAASIGPQTSEALRAAGMEVKHEAAESTIDGLVSAIVRGV